MRAVCQRVRRARVDAAGETVAAVDVGLVVYAAVGKNDKNEDADKLADKLVNLRIFDDGAPPAAAMPLLQRVRDRIRSHGLSCATGVFGAEMQVHTQVDGPVTILLNTA